MIIGITGGTGSGKTTLLDVIREKGGLVIDCDALYHQLLMQDVQLKRNIANRFPEVLENGEINRKKLGNRVFSDASALSDLNRITHTRIKEEVCEILKENPSLAAIDAIGLYESGLSELCHITIAVTAPEDVRMARLIARDNISADDAKKRIAAQEKQETFVKCCDFHLENSGTKDAFRGKCLAFLQEQGII